jgi:hypothetical protein
MQRLPIGSLELPSTVMPIAPRKDPRQLMKSLNECALRACTKAFRQRVTPAADGIDFDQFILDEKLEKQSHSSEPLL